ncbi:MAG: SpoIVB peptidase [Clostridia bacterium]|nr:SpoIVB peptidase [Clostridia bacterium]
MRIQKYKKWIAYILVLLCFWSGTGQNVLAAPEEVLPGGMPFGIKLACDGLVVVGFTEVVTDNGTCMPAFDAGLRINDLIYSINGERVSTSEEFAGKIENSSEAVEIQYKRAGEKYETTLKPVYSPADGKYKTGMWIRDTTAGIGTVTFIEPETGVFAGLGHGICDQNTGDLLPMGQGTVVGVTITGVSKGISGRPGELKGYFTEEKNGVLLGNTSSGVYGVLSKIPYAQVPEDKVPVGCKGDVQTGEAYIWCTLDGDHAEKFDICITDIGSETNGNFCITVTDEDLITRTGGIVQGMSGSPIIQNGKLIGAVTHVLINDPTKGYGIFIENMLAAAE